MNFFKMMIFLEIKLNPRKFKIAKKFLNRNCLEIFMALLEAPYDLNDFEFLPHVLSVSSSLSVWLQCTCEQSQSDLFPFMRW